MDVLKRCRPGDFLPECQSKYEWSGTEGEAEGKKQKFPFAKVGDLMCEEPRVQREGSGGVNGDAVIGKVYRVRRVEKGRKGIEVNAVLTDMKESMTECTHCADSVEGALSVLMCRRKEEQAETFATSEGHQVASLCLLCGGKKTGHLDRSEEGGRASNSNGFDSVGDSAVRGKTFRTGVDNFRDSPGLTTFLSGDKRDAQSAILAHLAPLF